jgi:hypothetical protein
MSIQRSHGRGDPLNLAFRTAMRGATRRALGLGCRHRGRFLDLAVAWAIVAALDARVSRHAASGLSGSLSFVGPKREET